MSWPSFVEPGFSSNTNVRDSEMAKRVKIGDVIQVLAFEGAAPFPGEFEIRCPEIES